MLTVIQPTSLMSMQIYHLQKQPLSKLSIMGKSQKRGATPITIIKPHETDIKKYHNRYLRYY